MSETSEILRTLLDRLQIAQNQGQLWFARLNAGAIFASYTSKKTGKTKGRRIKLCPAGTADVIVLTTQIDSPTHPHYSQYPHYAEGRFWPAVIFLETKLKNGELSDDQKAFKAMVEEQGATHLTVKVLEDATGPLGLGG